MEHFITLDRAIQMTTLFRENRDTVLAEAYRGQGILPTAETFDRAALDKILSQPGCRKLRIYYGMDEQRALHAILVGVDAEDRDQLPVPKTTSQAGGEVSSPATTADTTNGEEDDYVIVEVGTRCPPDCITTPPLNP